MDMQAFLVRLLIGIGVIWLIQLLVAKMALKEPAGTIIDIIVIIAVVIFIVTGGLVLNLR